MHDIYKIYPALTVLAIVIVACILFLRKPIMQLLKDRLHNPFKYEGIEKGSFWASWTLIIIVVLKIMMEVIGYLYDNNLLNLDYFMYGIMTLLFGRVLFFVIKGK